MCQQCNSCYKCKPYCECNNTVTYDPCQKDSKCRQKVDADCVIYEFNNINGLSALTTLKLPTGATLKQFMIAVDRYLANINQTTVTPNNLVEGNINGLRMQTFNTISTPENFYEAIYKQVQDNSKQLNVLEQFWNDEFRTILDKIGIINTVEISNSSTNILFSDSLTTVLNKIIYSISSILDRIDSLENNFRVFVDNKEIKISAKANNQIEKLLDGYYVKPADEISQTPIGVDNNKRSVVLYAEGKNNHTLSAEINLGTGVTGLTKNVDGSIGIDISTFLNYINNNPNLKQQLKNIINS